jgi:DNA topoisomerase-1
MMDRFPNIIDVEFTAGMEKQLDQVEEGRLPWKKVLEDFYGGFHQEMENAEEALKGTRLKVPDEETDEICELCGRRMVIKTGRFGKFLACPGYPECKNTKPLVEKMPGRCPKCGSTILKRKSKRGYAYYACERGAACGFMTWDVPTANDCPVCGQTMFKKSGRGQMKPFCINPECANFLPEDKRGYHRKPAAKTEDAAQQPQGAQQEPQGEPEEKPAVKKTAAKKPAVKKTAAKKPAAKKPAARKTAAKKPAARKTAAKKPAAKKPAAKKTAAKKPAAKKPTEKKETV